MEAGYIHVIFVIQRKKVEPIKPNKMKRFTTIINSSSSHNLASVTLYAGASFQQAVNAANSAAAKFNGEHKIVIFDAINFAKASEVELGNLSDDEYANVTYDIELLVEERDEEDEDWELTDSASFAALFCLDNVANVELVWKERI